MKNKKKIEFITNNVVDSTSLCPKLSNNAYLINWDNTLFNTHHEVDRKETVRNYKRIKKWADKQSENGNTRSTGFLYKLHTEKRLHGLLSCDSMEFGKQVDLFITLLKEKYGDLWDIKLEPISYSNEYCRFRVNVILHYPEINLYGDLIPQDNPHKIKDLFVMFNISSVFNSVKIGNPYLFRSTFSFLEFINGYSFSHIKVIKVLSIELDNYYSTDFLNPIGLCLGSGTALENFNVEQLINHEPLDETKILSYLYSIDSAIEWESSYGGPYMYVKDLKDKSEGTVVSDHYLHPSGFQDNYETLIFEEDFYNLLKFSYQDGRYIIKNIKEFTQALIQVALIHRPDLIVEKHGNSGVYRKFSGISNFNKEKLENYFDFKGHRTGYNKLENDGVDMSFQFRDKVIELIIEEEIEKEELKLELHIQERFRNYVKEQIEHTINKQNESRNLITRYLKSDLYTRSTK